MKITGILSCIFGKNSVKATILLVLNKLLKSWFDEKKILVRENFSFFHSVTVQVHLMLIILGLSNVGMNLSSNELQFFFFQHFEWTTLLSNNWNSLSYVGHPLSRKCQEKWKVVTSSPEPLTSLTNYFNSHELIVMIMALNSHVLLEAKKKFFFPPLIYVLDQFDERKIFNLWTTSTR